MGLESTQKTNLGWARPASKLPWSYLIARSGEYFSRAFHLYEIADCQQNTRPS